MSITAWAKKVWKDRQTEYPTRRTLTKTDGSQEIVTVARNEGAVSQEGDAFSAANMNDLEERIDAGFTEVTGKLSVKYDTDTDTVQIYYDGAWIDWTVANLQAVYLYKAGRDIVQMDTIGYKLDNGGTATTSTKYAKYVSLPYQSTMYQGCTFSTAETIDITDVKNIIVKGTLNGQDIEYSLDVSALSGKYYFVVSNYHGSGGQQIVLCLCSSKYNYVTNNKTLKYPYQGNTSYNLTVTDVFMK